MARILIADDEPANRSFLTTLLGYCGHHTFEASDGAGALREAHARRPDLVIADILMPTMDGYEFVRELRRDPVLAHTPVIFWSAIYHEREAQALAESCGVRHLIIKPAEPEAILEVVSAALLEASAAPAPALENFSRNHSRLLVNKLTSTTEDLRAANSRLAALLDIGQQLAAEREPESLIRTFCPAARELIGCRYAGIGILNGGGGLDVLAVAGMDPETLQSVAPSVADLPVLRAVVSESRPVRGAAEAFTGALAHLATGSLLAAPLQSPNRTLGVAFFLDKLGKKEFGEEDEKLAVTLAAQAGVAYENAVNYARVQQHAAALEREIEERKEVERALRTSEQKFAKVFYSNPRPMVISALNGSVAEVNDSLVEETGFTREELTGWTDAELPLWEEAGARRLKEILSSGALPRDCECAFHTKSGEMRTGLVSAERIELSGQPSRLWILKDITERKRAEEALRQEGEKLRKLNRTLRAHTRSDQALFLATDEAAYLKEVCDIIVRDCGHAMVWVGFREEDVARTVRPVAFEGYDDGYLETLNITWADTERGRGPTGTAIRTGRAQACRDMLTDPLFLPWREEAVRRGYASSIALPLMAAGQAFGALTIYSREPDPFSDDEVKLLTDLAADLAYGINVLRLRAAHARAEETLKESEERFRLIADTMPNLVWTARADGTVDYVNRYFKNYTGSLAQGGDEWGSGHVHPDDRDSTFEAWQEAVRTGRPYRREHRIKRFDGIYRWHLSRGVPVLDSHNRVVKWYGTATDVDELREAQERLRRANDELRRSNEDLEQFAYVCSHDLQEPLRVVTGFVQLLQEQYAGKLDSSADSYIGFVVEGARRMRQLIEELLGYSRIGMHAREPVPIDSGQALDVALSNLGVSIREGNAEIVRGQLPVVRADGQQLVQLFQNLVGNAIKFRGTCPLRISVNAERDGDCYVFSVTDNGIGIDPQFHNKVFLIFQRLHTKEKYPGIGIGLAICKKIVDRHGGRIWVESTPGRGSTFRFSLPA